MRARRALGCVALTMVAAAAISWALVAAGGRLRARPGGDARLVLVFAHEEADATVLPTNERADLREAAASLTVGALSDTSAAALAKEIHRWHVLVDIAHNPLSVDLEDEDLEARMKTTYGALSPRLMTATSLLAGVWRADDGLTVRIAHGCEPGEQCAVLADPPTGDRVEARARFLAWPLANALHVRVARRDRVDAVANELRRGVDTPSSAVSLVVDAGSLATAPADAGTKTVQTEAQGLLKALGRRAPAKQKELASSFAGGTAPQEVAPWLTLADDEILVIPRLSYLGRLPELVAEVRGLLTQLDEPGATLVTPNFVPDPD